MTGTIAKTNKDGSVNLVTLPKGWLLEDTVTGKIIDETDDYTIKDKWVKDYKLSRNVGQFWYKEDKVMNGCERNAESLNTIFSGYSSTFGYTLEDVRDSINRYLDRDVIKDNMCKSWGGAAKVKQALIDLREVINNAIEQGKLIDEDDVASAQIVARDCLYAYHYNQFLMDIINPLLEVLNKDTVDTSEVQKQMSEGKKSFTPEEVDELYEGIVQTGDDRFYDWLYSTYPWITQDNIMTMNLEDFMLQWIYSTPGIYEEMREWLDYWDNEENQ